MLASRQAKAQSGRIYVAALQPMVKEIFEISALQPRVPGFVGCAKALGAVSDEATAFDKG